MKISIKRPYLEDNDDSEFSVGRKPEEEIVVNVSSPIGNPGSYFSNAGDFNKPSESLQSYRRNGFSSEDKLGFPSMIYTTFSHPAAGAVTLTQSFDNRLTTTTSPKTTLITPINGETSPTEPNFDHQTKSDSQSHASCSVMNETATNNQATNFPLENGGSHEESVENTPTSTSTVTSQGN